MRIPDMRNAMSMYEIRVMCVLGWIEMPCEVSWMIPVLW